MSEPAELPETDLDTQLRGLFQEAEQIIQGRGPSRPDAEKDANRLPEERVLKTYASLPQMLRPMVLGLEAISRATGENAQLLQRIDRTHLETTGAHRSLPTLIAALEALLEQKNSVSQRMFDALHEELKDYKDGFLIETILKPVIRDLISLYDELSTIQRQMQQCVTEVAAGSSDGMLDRLRWTEMNLSHHCEFVIEILARLDVSIIPAGVGLLDKQAQRAVAIEMVDDPALDMTVARSVKRGFLWKDRVLRAEEVVMNRWNRSGAEETPNHSALMEINPVGTDETLNP